ncbi:hypothetical protein LTR04_000759 [Oleoguttula sp. CCFEE 6159]|nr:hypothetical protein LTR04_000759 [Oleoguttula sp. CCFEE 6159]
MTASSIAARRHAAPAGTSRGGIAKRRGGVRTDRDGDLMMDAPGRGRGKTGKAGARTSTGPAGIPLAARTADSRGARNLERLTAGLGGVSRPRASNLQKPLKEIKITGWSGNKAKASDDGGVSTLIAWLEKRATTRNGAAKKAVKIKKSRVDGETLVISVNEDDVPAVLRVNGFVFAGVNIAMERPRSMSPEISQSGAGHELKRLLTSVIDRRYNSSTKLLDLRDLAHDPEIAATGLFNEKESTRAKFFPALMKVCEGIFGTLQQRKEAVLSITLENNEIPSTTAITTIAPTFPDLKNLDLSNNQFRDIASLEGWKLKFRHLEHLVLSGNPIEQENPDYHATITRWYPGLRFLNGVQVRSEEEAAINTKGVTRTLPFPVKGPSFVDHDQVAENFIKNFFPGFDSDRATLANYYYDAQSDFSLSVNTAAMRDPNQQQTGVPQEWDSYIKKSRNLKKVTHLPARMSRHFRGPQAIAECWATLPTTRHPDLATDPSKWLIECQPIPYVPDPSGQSPFGVSGLLITLHGEYEEIDVSSGQAKKQRSFDRTFVLGPGGGPEGVRVVNDLLTVRAYGGFAAFKPEEENAVSAVAAAPGAPGGITVEVAEQMVVELTKQTGMLQQYSKDCLEQAGWDFNKALETFAAVRQNLPAEYFAQAPVLV